MADQALQPTDVADQASDAVAADPTSDVEAIAESTDPIMPEAPSEPVVAGIDAGEGNLLGELARAMHAAATLQYERLNSELERRRSEQVEAISARAETETENLKADAESDIGAIDAWAKAETEKIKLERLRRIDGRREQLAAEVERQATIKESEVFAIEAAIDAHRNEVDLFFGRMERETDPSAIARIAATMPPFPSLGDVAEQARRGAAAEFASLDGEVGAFGAPTATTTAVTGSAATTTPTATTATTGSASPVTGSAEAATEPETLPGAEFEPDLTVSETRLMAVMDPSASRGEGEPTQPWEAPYAVSVAAGTGLEDEEPAPGRVGSTLLRTVRSIRPMAGRHDKGSGEDDASR